MAESSLGKVSMWDMCLLNLDVFLVQANRALEDHVNVF